MVLSSIYQHREDQDARFAALLGSRIRDLRLHAGLTQAQLGLPRTRSFVSAVEHGRTLPSLRALLQMSERLGVPMAVLIGELDSTGPETYTWRHASHYATPGAS
jgi:transcriptional regulator with XRE-family HTH domain